MYNIHEKFPSNHVRTIKKKKKQKKIKDTKQILLTDESLDSSWESINYPYSSSVYCEA